MAGPSTLRPVPPAACPTSCRWATGLKSGPSKTRPPRRVGPVPPPTLGAWPSSHGSKPRWPFPLGEQPKPPGACVPGAEPRQGPPHPASRLALMGPHGPCGPAAGPALASGPRHRPCPSCLPRAQGALSNPACKSVLPRPVAQGPQLCTEAASESARKVLNVEGRPGARPRTQPPQPITPEWPLGERSLTDPRSPR